MPIRNCPLTRFENKDGNIIHRPILNVRIINPHTNKQFLTRGLIDTGADECAIPAGFAPVLGHNLQDGKTKTIMTGNGPTSAYSHTTRFEIYHPKTNKLLYVLDDTPIDFMPNLHTVLLGVNNFMVKFKLEIDYPATTFSLRNTNLPV